MKLIEKYNAIQKIGHTVDLPHAVWTALGTCKTMYIMGDQVQLGEGDFVKLEQAQEAVLYLADQLGLKLPAPKKGGQGAYVWR